MTVVSEPAFAHLDYIHRIPATSHQQHILGNSVHQGYDRWGESISHASIAYRTTALVTIVLVERGFSKLKLIKILPKINTVSGKIESFGCTVN